MKSVAAVRAGRPVVVIKNVSLFSIPCSPRQCHVQRLSSVTWLSHTHLEVAIRGDEFKAASDDQWWLCRWAVLCSSTTGMDALRSSFCLNDVPVLHFSIRCWHTLSPLQTFRPCMLEREYISEPVSNVYVPDGLAGTAAVPCRARRRAVADRRRYTPASVRRRCLWAAGGAHEFRSRRTCRWLAMSRDMTAVRFVRLCLAFCSLCETCFAARNACSVQMVAILIAPAPANKHAVGVLGAAAGDRGTGRSGIRAEARWWTARNLLSCVVDKVLRERRLVERLFYDAQQPYSF